MPDLDRIVIFGAGLVGTSIGMACREAGCSVYLHDRVPSHALVAAGIGAGSIEGYDPASITLVVIAVPPTAIPGLIAQSLERYPNAVVTDVGSVKHGIAASLPTRLDTGRYVGSHPMAGSQHTGPLTASASLFRERTWVVTPRAENPETNVVVVEKLAEICDARPVRMDAPAHDAAVARVSHLPHLMSILTADQLLGLAADELLLAGQGVRDVTRIAASDPMLWRQILQANREPVRQALLGVQQRLAELVTALDDPTDLQGILSRGREGAKSLPGKHGGQASVFESVVIEIPDSPGALASLFADIQTTGVNIEDLSIQHDMARNVGWLSIAVAEAKPLRDAMVAAGWQVQG